MSVASKHKWVGIFARLTTPVIIIVLAGFVSVGIANRFETELASKFEHESEHNLQIAILKLDNYRDLLYAGRAFLVSGGPDTSASWRGFYNQQAVFERYPGVSSIAYVTKVDTNELKSFEAKMQKKEYFGSQYKLSSVSEREDHGFVSVYVTNNDLTKIEGLDLLLKDDRYEVYKRAAMKMDIVASPSINLATGHKGFFSLLPVYDGKEIDGYILTSFRLQELMQELFTSDSLGYRVTDTTDEPVQIYRTKTWTDNGYTHAQTIAVGGRTWKVETSGIVEQRPVGFLLPPAIMATSLLLSAAIYLLSSKSPRQRLNRL